MFFVLVIIIAIHNAEAVVIKSHMTTKDPKRNTSCEPPIPTFSFSIDDERVYSWLFIDNVVLLDKISWKWYRPDNTLHQEWNNAFAEPDSCTWSWLALSDEGVSPGNWHIDVFNNGIFEFTDNFTITSKTTCPSEQIYGEQAEQTELLRYIRDSVLSQSPTGQEIIRLYYEWSPAIVQAMEEDDDFKADVKEMVDGFLELIGGGVE